MFDGVTVALVTPFKGGEVDWEALSGLIERQIEAGVDVILPCGCTGEAATLSHEEQKKVIRFTVEKVDSRVLVLAGTGSNNTQEALDLTFYAKEVGADGALLITPYYNKPTQEGLYQHYHSIAQAVQFPVMLYNVPGRTGVSLSSETVVRLSQDPFILSIKEATGTVSLADQIMRSCDLMVLSGDDALTLPMMSIGAQGVVSVLANVLPQKVVEFVQYVRDGLFKEAVELHTYLYEINKALFVTTNPIPVKMLLAQMGLIEEEFRLPLTVEESSRNVIKKIADKYDLL